MSRSRFFIAAIIVAAASAVVFWLIEAPRSAEPEPPAGGLGGEADPGPPPTTTRELALRTSAECRACHEEVFAEWEGSHHAIAYTNPEVQKLSRNFRDRDCLPCHASRPVFETGLGNRVLEREVRLEEGVDCFTCHQFKNAMLGNPARLDGSSDAPCNPLPYAGVMDLRLCSPCHDQHKVMQDWLLTEFAGGPAKQDCLDCHMPPAPRKATAGRAAYMGRSHRFPAAHDPDMLRKAASMTTSVGDDGRLRVTVRNDGTGHNVPADERHRAVDLVLTVREAGGESSTARIDRYRNPYRDEFHLRNPLREPGGEHAFEVGLGDLGRAHVRVRRVPAAFNPGRKVFYPESTQIPAGESREYVVTLPPKAASATVRLIYKLNPFVEDDRGTLLHEQAHEIQAGRAEAPGGVRPVAAPVAPGPGGSLDRAERILAEARAQGRAFVPELLLLMKDRSQSAFVLVPDPAAPRGLRVEENPHGGEDTRSLERIAAITALGRIGSPEAIPELLLALDDRDGLPALHAAEALVGFGNRSGIPVLLAGLEKKVYENENANEILKRLSGEDFGFDSDAGMSARWAAIGRWRDWWRRFEGSGAKLRGEGEPYRKGADEAADRRISRYVDVAGEFQFLYMEQARKMLRRLGPPAVPFLEEGIARAPGLEGATWRAEIAHILGGIAAPEAHALLLRLAADPHPTVRARAVAALAASGAPAAAARAREALEDPDASVVLNAVRALALSGTPEDAARLATLDGRGRAELAREVDLARLRLDRSAETFDAVADHLFDPSIAARTAALDVLNALAGRVVLDDAGVAEETRRDALETWRGAILAPESGPAILDR